MEKKGRIYVTFFRFQKINKTSYPRQKLDKFYWQNGYVDIFKPSTIQKYKNELGKKFYFMK